MEPSDDTVIIPYQCGTCYFFKPQPAPIAANNGTPGDADTVQGQCFYNPPTPFLVQQKHPLTGQVTAGTTSLSPTIPSDRSACHGWCPDSVDPFESDEFGPE